MLPNGTRFHINDALYSSKSTRDLLSFKDICKNGYHIETMNEGNKESLYITSIIYGKNIVAEKLPTFSFRLYYTTIKPIESYVVMNQKFNHPKIFTLWHNRLGHPRSSMMRRIIEQSHGHPLKNQKILLPNEFSCDPCSQGKLIARPLLMKTKLPTSTWGYSVMHAASLIRIRPTSYHEYSPSQLVLGKQPNIYHLRIFGYAIYIPIAPTQHIKMGP